MAGFRTAEALRQLFRDIDVLAPNRRRVSDGTIGDGDHQTRKSDHNPDGNGVVRAIDVTHDPAGGADMALIAEQLRRRRDPRAKYIIFNRRIASVNSDWQWKTFKGTNPHVHHMHVSAVADSRADDPASWGLRPQHDERAKALDLGTAATPAEIVPEQRGPEVLVLQQLMIRIGLIRDRPGNRDGHYGPATVGVIRDFQAKHGLTIDGRVGRNTWRVLFSFDPAR